MATGELADAIHRDLIADRLTFDELGWRGLWAYVIKAPPRTAIYEERSRGLTTSDDIALEQLNVLREVNWRYTRVHFEGGDKTPFPQSITRESLFGDGEPQKPAEPITLEELIPPHVRALLQGV